MATTSTPSLHINRWGTISWVFMRLSALALIILALGHFVVQHVIFDVHDLDLQFVADRWADTGWRIYDGLLLALGLIHGMNGLRMVADDYILNRRINLAVRVLILLVGLGLLALGTAAIIVGVRMPA